jgi:hypothetical protein
MKLDSVQAQTGQDNMKKCTIPVLCVLVRVECVIMFQDLCPSNF